jgi:hypothetical protein
LVPVRDTEEWVGRPKYVREQEKMERQGHIPRPSNAFMLYRRAYLKRAEVWFDQNMSSRKPNKQPNLSQLTGRSWKLEPPETREYYKKCADIERKNHRNAHGSYKYSPQIKRRKTSSKQGGGSYKEHDSATQEYTDSVSHDTNSLSNLVLMPEAPATQSTQHRSQFLGPTSRTCCMLPHDSTFVPCMCTMSNTQVVCYGNNGIYHPTLIGGLWTYAAPPLCRCDCGMFSKYPAAHSSNSTLHGATIWSGDDSKVEPAYCLVDDTSVLYS